MNSKYDWSTGAYEQVFTVKPDRAEEVIADLNFESSAHAHGRKDAVRCVYKYTDFLEEFITGLPTGFFTHQPHPEEVEVLSPIQTWSDGLSMVIEGTPSVVNDFSAGEFMETHYHSQYDNENSYQEPVYHLHHEMYTGLVLAFDRTAVMPMNFARLFEGTAVSIDSSVHCGARADLPGLRVVLDKGIEAGEILYEEIRGASRIYGRFLDRGEEEKAVKLAARCRLFNREPLWIFKKEQDCFVRLSWYDDTLLPQQAVQENVRAMDRVIACLENHDLTGALEAICTIDNDHYTFLFEEEAYTYFTEHVLGQPAGRLEQGAGRIVHHQNLLGPVEGLKAETIEENPDTQKEYEVLVKARENQLCCYEDDTRYTVASAGEFLEAIRRAGQWASNIKKDSDTDESKIQEG